MNLPHPPTRPALAMLLFLLCVLVSLFPATHAQGTNGTDTQCPINIPGFFHRGNCKLLCRPTTWTDIILFYFGNYAAHAATVVSHPGQSLMSTLLTIVTALFFPGSGVRNGIAAIRSFAIFGDTNLQVAARAGALCAVVKVSPADRQIEGETNDQAGSGSGGLEKQGESAVDRKTVTPDLETASSMAQQPQFQGRCLNFHLNGGDAKIGD